MRGRTLGRSEETCSTTRTAAGRSPGRRDMSWQRASTPPAEAPTTMRSRVGMRERPYTLARSCAFQSCVLTRTRRRRALRMSRERGELNRMAGIKVALVDDPRVFREGLRALLGTQPDL